MFNWLKNLFNPPFNRAKSDVIRELDRALIKLRSGETVAMVVGNLRTLLSGILAKYALGGPIGAMLLDIVLASVNWEGLAQKPAADVIRELERIRKQVEGARL